MKDTIHITASGNKQYDVLFVDHHGALADEISRLKDPIIFVDERLTEAYPELMTALKKAGPVYQVHASEESKTLHGSTKVLDSLAASQAARDSTVVAIGGGIVQDIVSFAAHVYYRGLPFVFVPTTLLAMCDSCIGGKCGLNFNGFKNQLGAFHPPEKVIIWDGFLETLPDEALYSGYGEIFKFMLIGAEKDYDRFKREFVAEGIKSRSVREYIRLGLLIKKKFIEEDEFDNGVRRILNYGHTFGHAIELVTDYRVPHGIAVVYGIDIANWIAFQKGILSESRMQEIHDLIYACFPFKVFSGIRAEQLLESVAKDKKAAHGKIDMVLLERQGKFRLETILIDKSLGDIVHGYLSNSFVVFDQ